MTALIETNEKLEKANDIIMIDGHPVKRQDPSNYSPAPDGKCCGKPHISTFPDISDTLNR